MSATASSRNAYVLLIFRACLIVPPNNFIEQSKSIQQEDKRSIPHTVTRTNSQGGLSHNIYKESQIFIVLRAFL